MALESSKTRELEIIVPGTKKGTLAVGQPAGERVKARLGVQRRWNLNSTQTKFRIGLVLLLLHLRTIHNLTMPDEKNITEITETSGEMTPGTANVGMMTITLVLIAVKVPLVGTAKAGAKTIILGLITVKVPLVGTAKAGAKLGKLQSVRQTDVKVQHLLQLLLRGSGAHRSQTPGKTLGGTTGDGSDERDENAANSH